LCRTNYSRSFFFKMSLSIRKSAWDVCVLAKPLDRTATGLIWCLALTMVSVFIWSETNRLLWYVAFQILVKIVRERVGFKDHQQRVFVTNVRAWKGYKREWYFLIVWCCVLKHHRWYYAYTKDLKTSRKKKKLES
jgi:hypothetical protein